MNDETILLPCPFCGGEVQWKDGRIRCENCDFGFRRYFDHEKNNQAWNTRAELGNGTLTADDVLNAVYKHGARWQAIADELNATLGGGECENANKDGYGFRFKCSECGYSAIVHNCAVRLDGLPRFCPCCGRKVVGEC